MGRPLDPHWGEYVDEAVDKVNTLIIESKLTERQRIFNAIRNMRLDISSEAIVNGRVDIMPHIADVLEREVNSDN